jgi:tol-pal system protein YbgF
LPGLALPATAFSSGEAPGSLAKGQPISIVSSKGVRVAQLEKHEAKETTKESQERHEMPNGEYDTPTSLYAKALSYLRDQKMPALARKEFNKFIANFSGHRLMPNVLYWLGETYYTEKRYDRALEFFEKVVGRYPGHSKAPDALLKIGYTNKMLGNMPTARYYLEDLIRRYPKSHSAKLARSKLREWK